LAQIFRTAHTQMSTAEWDAAMGRIRDAGQARGGRALTNAEVVAALEPPGAETGPTLRASVSPALAADLARAAQRAQRPRATPLSRLEAQRAEAAAALHDRIYRGFAGPQETTAATNIRALEEQIAARRAAAEQAAQRAAARQAGQRELFRPREMGPPRP
jgi:hypothetical protein